MDHPEAIGELVGVGADLEPGTLLAAYRQGLFPMPLPMDMRVKASGLEPIGWWSPDPRGVLPLNDLKVSRSMRKSARRYEVRVDTAFDTVLHACADPQRPHGWIDRDIIVAYQRLHRLGWAHSVEAWSIDDGELAGGLYGIAIGGLFAGESMFHWRTDASKIALMGLVGLLKERRFALLDVQWQTDHLASLGVVAIERQEYLRSLAVALAIEPEPLGALVEPWRF